MALEMFAYKRYASVAKYSGTEKYVVIPQQYNGVPVTEIRADAFAHNTAIEGVFIPNTLLAIGANAFANCHNLKFIGPGLEDDEHSDIPALPEDQRPDLSKLSEEDLPTSSLIPAAVHVVDSGAFAETGITNIAFKSTNLELGDSAFEGCQCLDMVALLHCKRLMLGKRCFMNSSIGRLYAPEARIDTVPDYAFANCSQLATVLGHISAVGDRAFYLCEKLRRLNAPKEFRSIGRDAFFGCDRLEGVNIPQKRPPRSPKPAPEEGKADTFGDILKRVSMDELDDFLMESIDRTIEQLETEIAEEVVQQENSPEVTGTNSGEPLFQLHVGHLKGKLKTIPTALKGYFMRCEGGFRFGVQIPSALNEADLQTATGQHLPNMMQLIGFLAKNNAKVILTGQHTKQTYSVYDITPVASAQDKEVSPELLRLVIERLKHPVPESLELGDAKPPFTMRTETEYEAFLELCSSRLPAWVIQAYNRNKDAAHRRNGRISDDEAKHARRAQEILLNTNWLPYVVNVPPVDEVRRILDEEFYGLEPIKTRIMEVVAQMHKTHTLPKWGILLNGPAGVGKTSIAKAVARILGMPLIQLDMTSIGEEPESISGSSRVYSNARPGMLLDKMYLNRSSTALLLANEVEKACEGKNGHLGSDILLSILDKTGFYENFLEEIVPTDNLFCIGTCNDLSKISKPLRDRFLVIDIPGYATDEKKVIFQDYVFPSIKAKSNIHPDQLTLDEEAVDLLLSDYALEPGARDLEQYSERIVGDYCRNSDEYADGKRVYTTEDLRSLFGPGKTISRHFAVNPGQVNAAFYHDSKAYFFLVEAALVPGSGKFKAFGPITKIQEEYCEVAYWCARNTINRSACDFSKYDVAIFIPQRIPEGIDNHVGLACYTAICSKLMNTNLAISDTCFIGGCDMNGSLYFDENDLSPLMRSMKARGISTLYAPMGTTQRVDAKANSDCNILIVEAPDAKTLFSLAVAQSAHKH